MEEIKKDNMNEISKVKIGHINYDPNKPLKNIEQGEQYLDDLEKNIKEENEKEKNKPLDAYGGHKKGEKAFYYWFDKCLETGRLKEIEVYFLKCLYKGISYKQLFIIGKQYQNKDFYFKTIDDVKNKEKDLLKKVSDIIADIQATQIPIIDVI